MAKSKTVSLANLPNTYRRAGDVEAFVQRPEVIAQLVAIVRAKQAQRVQAANRRAEDAAFAQMVAREVAADGLMSEAAVLNFFKSIGFGR